MKACIVWHRWWKYKVFNRTMMLLWKRQWNNIKMQLKWTTSRRSLILDIFMKMVFNIERMINLFYLKIRNLPYNIMRKLKKRVIWEPSTIWVDSILIKVSAKNKNKNMIMKCKPSTTSISHRFIIMIRHYIIWDIASWMAMG